MLGVIACLVFVLAAQSSAWQSGSPAAVAERVKGLTRDASWKLTATVPLAFATHHPQGMVKIGRTFFVSSVEIRTRTRRFAQPVDGYDRDAGEGVGHLFKVDETGKLIQDLTLGEGAIYHPGGIDYDGTHIWVPVAEYRPNSRSIVYRVDPETMKAAEVLRFDDHIGAIVHDTDSGSLHGVSWGSRRFYRWTLATKRGAAAGISSAPPAKTFNGSHYIDYQDCKYAGGHSMLCTGVAEVRQRPDAPPLRLGGVDLVDLRDGRAVHQAPILLWTPAGLSVTQNPAWFEATADGGLRGYFMPEDDKSSIYVYEAAAK